MTNSLTVTAPEGVPFIDIEREFDFPVEAVFQAHSEPDLYVKWVGPRGYEMKLTEFDFTTGGRYRYINIDNGVEYAFNGVFHVVRPNEFAIQTFEWEGMPDVVSLESLTFERLEGGRTRLKAHSVYPSQEARDGLIENGMEQGVKEGYEKLDELLAGDAA